MAISYNSFLKKISKSKDKIFLFNGDENYLKNEAINIIKDKYKDKYDIDFDFIEYYGKDAVSDELASELSAAPMLNEFRLIIINNIDKCDVKSKNIIKKWLDNPNDTIIFLSTTSEQINLKKTTQVFTKLSEVATVVTCYKLDYSEMREWIIDTFTKYEKSVDENVVEYLIDMVGFDLYKMNNEIKKINLCIKKNSININDVNKIVSDIRADTIFDLIDSMISKDLRKSIRISKTVISETSDAIALISLLYKKMTQGYIVKDLINKNVDDNKIRESLSISPYALMQIKNTLPQISKLNIFKLFSLLLEFDIKLKSSSNSIDIFNDLIIQFCS